MLYTYVYIYMYPIDIPIHPIKSLFAQWCEAHRSIWFLKEQPSFVEPRLFGFASGEG